MITLTYSPLMLRAKAAERKLVPMKALKMLALSMTRRPHFDVTDLQTEN